MNKKDQPSLSAFHIPRWNELPTVELYLDQVVKLINGILSPYINFSLDPKDENELLTKTMINNYVKNNLIEPPIKKQYSRVQISKLFVICVLKQVYSMQDINCLINMALEYSNSRIELAYNQFCKLFEQALICTYEKKDFIDSRSSRIDSMYLLKSVLLSCSYKIYSKNTVINYKSEE